ncbi:MAG: YqgE/AlgH family protein [Rhodospirillales bacterium]|jgi:putative transcriptional regulator|nr:YqgE/AlgH family protein [Rhodospirillales bacterium]
MRWWRFPTILVLAFVVALASVPVDGADEHSGGGAFDPRLKGRFLVATPKMSDPRFRETVIFMVDHDANGARGFVVNRVHGRGQLSALMEGFGVGGGNEGSATSQEITLHYGGPVEPGRGFVLHSDDYADNTTVKVTTGVSLSLRLRVLKALAGGEGPSRVLVVLGYSSWSAQQLEGELFRDDWLTAPADAELIFDDDDATKWQRAFAKAGVQL